MNVKRLALWAGVAFSLMLAACGTGTIPIEDLQAELGSGGPSTPTPEPTATSAPTATPEPTALPAITLPDGQNDCVTGSFAPIDCSVLQRDVTSITLETDDENLIVTVTIEGEAWEQFPDQFAVFQFDIDSDSATGSRTAGIAHGMGTDTNIFWGWTSSSTPFGGERYDEVGTISEQFGERDELVTVVDEHTLRLEISFADIGSDTFKFIFSLQAPPSVGIFDYVPEQGETIEFSVGG